ncbi:DUF3606 domain-containing protein [Pedobacter deserti]|uniref:DUF3606 domain-containing protein n=1 Tax=Pedobacter deserti TaxID=2817382 RepID=UPI00210C3977|nr:DUF3606 domain-containing protein [Pedobacter sp. SYSU D00382]
MNSPINIRNKQLIDFSEFAELNYWSLQLKATPEAIKTAARACCSNAVGQISEYLHRKKQTQTKRSVA